jgi:hypothetical protein
MWTMSRRHQAVATASALLLGAVLLAGTPAPVVLAGSGNTTCRVRNVTHGTQGRSFKSMVGDSRDGDRLLVRGTCTSAGVVIDKDLTIIGVDDAILHGRDRALVLRIRIGATVTIRHLRIAHGNGDVGGGILNRGDLDAVDIIVQRNRARAGGGIVSYGTVRVTDSIIRRNRAGGAGGIWIAAGTASLEGSRVTTNRAVDQGGGGVFNWASLTVTNSLISRNRADRGGGGGVANRGSLIIVDSAVGSNTAGTYAQDNYGGGGILNRGQLTLTGSTVRGNSIGGDPGGGGGIFNWQGEGTVALDAGSSVTGNTPDDCVGTPAC